VRNEQSMSRRYPAGDQPWSAYDVARQFGRSVEWARQSLARWMAVGLVEVVSRDSITGARLYSPDQVKTAQESERGKDS
jgi:hypothetical protein